MFCSTLHAIVQQYQLSHLWLDKASSNKKNVEKPYEYKFQTLIFLLPNLSIFLAYVGKKW